MHTHRAVKHLLNVLNPYMKENGGMLKVEHLSYVEGRGNLMIEYENVSETEPISVHLDLYIQGEALTLVKL